jgi:glycine/D-amino acid oxidase-like deaminating enzyme/nitrite reductase/ring-hydroxylating ferredoxin subunit
MHPTTSESESLWLDSTSPLGQGIVAGDRQYDVAVLGGGITGLTTALLLKREGLRVAVLEAARVGSGVTGTTTGKVSALQATMYSAIRQHHGTEAAAAYAAASTAAVEQVSTLATENSIECALERRPAFTYAASEKEVASVEAEAHAAREAGLAVELTDAVDLPFDVAAAIRLDDQLQFHPVQYARGLAAIVSGGGSDVFEETRALGLDFRSPFEFKTPGGTVKAQHVVVATHYPILDRGIYFARMKVQRSYCIAAKVRGPAPHGMSISAGSSTRSIRSHEDGLIVGGEGHEAGSFAATPARFERLEAFARAHWDVEEVTHRWSAQDPVPYDHLPMIGSYVPGSRHLLVATGFMKWGLTTGTFAAMMLRDAIVGRQNEWSSSFDPNRVSLRSSAALVQMNAKVGAELVGDRLRSAEVRSAAEVAPDEGRVVSDGLAKRGVYRDTDGALHSVSLRCTHLGCLLRFNSAERSWDCPCHGSRFDIDGNVLEGPATRPLAKSPGGQDVHPRTSARSA